MLKAIIVDDEQEGRTALRLALEQFCPDVELLADCGNPSRAVDLIRELEPDLVFLDILMPGMTGFGVLEQFPELPFQVIFVSAHTQYAIQAIRFSALDYLPKPVDIDDLQKAIQRALSHSNQDTERYKLQSFMDNYQFHQNKVRKLAIPSTEGIDYIDFSDILYCQSQKSYTDIFLNSGKKMTSSRHLGRFEEVLDTDHFFRVHNSYLININEIRKYFRGEGGQVRLSDGTDLPVSRRRKDELLLRMSGLGFSL